MTPTTAEAVDAATGLDAAFVRIQFAQDLTSTLFLVYDEDPVDVVADYTYHGIRDHHLIERALNAFQAEWKDKPCPITPAPAPAGENQ
jgi:hypothetical protein